MTYAVEFRSCKLPTLSWANTLCERVRSALASLPHQGSVMPTPGFIDEWGEEQRIQGWGWGHFKNLEDAVRYALDVVAALRPLGIDWDDIGPVGYAGAGCGEVNWDKVEVIR